MKLKATIGGILLMVFLVFPKAVWADQPKLGFNGTLVELRGEFEPFRGLRVDRVWRGTPAEAMGLERGDIVVFIGRTMAFTNHRAYLYALRQQGAVTDIGIINVRNGELVWCKCRLGHNEQPHLDEQPPPGVIMVDLADNMN